MASVSATAASNEMMLRCGTPVVFRDLTPDDESLYPDFHAQVSARDRRLRFFTPAPIGPSQIHRLTHFEADEAVVRAAIGRADGRLYGVSRLHRVNGEAAGEFAVMVRSDLKGQGLGRALLCQVLARAPSIGVSRVYGLILPENIGMLALARELGFEMTPDPTETGILRASLDVPPGTLTPIAA